MSTPGARESGPIALTQPCENVLITCEIAAVPLVPEVTLMSFETAMDCAGPKPNANCFGTYGGLVTWSWMELPVGQPIRAWSKHAGSVADGLPVPVVVPSKITPKSVMTAEAADTV